MHVRVTLFCMVLSIFFSPSPARSNELSKYNLPLPELQQDPNLLQELLNKPTVVKSPVRIVQSTEHQDQHSGHGGSRMQEQLEPLNEDADGDLGFADVPHMSLRGFFDISYIAILKGPNNSSFAAGQLSLQFNSQLSERINFMAETYFSNPASGQSTFILTRANLQYLIAEFFNVEVGQMHTPIGYWNHAYHHGTWLQTTINRPEIFRYDQAYVPIHSFGIELFGLKSFNSYDAEYAFDILNGRGRTPTEVVRVQDYNDSKAVNLHLNLKPHFIEGLQLGPTLYLDTIPPNPGVVTRTGSIYERIVGGHAVYYHANVELLGELFSIYHDDTSKKVYMTTGFYLQGGYKMGRFTPYYRFDFMNFTDGEPYFVDTEDKSIHTVGLRWDIATWNAIKVEYSFEDMRHSEDVQSFTINSSFVF